MSSDLRKRAPTASSTMAANTMTVVHRPRYVDQML
jgi:hypothetical protein